VIFHISSIMHRFGLIFVCLVSTGYARRSQVTRHDEQSRDPHPLKELARALLSGMTPRAGWQAARHGGVTGRQSMHYSKPPLPRSGAVRAEEITEIFFDDDDDHQDKKKKPLMNNLLGRLGLGKNGKDHGGKHGNHLGGGKWGGSEIIGAPEDMKKILEGLGIGGHGQGGMIVVRSGDEEEVVDDEGPEAGGSGNEPGGGRKEEKSAATVESIQNFDLRPKEIVEYLDRYVIRQDNAKKVLAVAICDHYNHVRRYLSSPEASQPINYAKPNILLAGPTGVGKTYLMKSIARLIGVPFVKGDATKFSETGIVGKDAEDLVHDLVDAAGGNTTVAQFGIIYIDEIDKIATGGGGSSANFHGDFNKRGVQNNFLKLLEDTDVPLERETGLRLGGLLGGLGGAQRPSTINTRNILFIFSGAFTGLDAEIKRRKEHKSFGFAAADSTPNAGDSSSESKAPAKTGSYLSHAETSDFVSAGLEPEFVGRVPVRVALDALDADDLKEILTNAEGSVLGQFVRDFEGYSINMTASDAALTEVAKLAAKEGTGARGLVTVLERTLREHKYELPSSSIRGFELDNSTVVSPADGLKALLSSQTTEDTLNVKLDDLKRWERKLNKKIEPVHMRFQDEAIDYMIGLSLESGESPYSIANRKFEKIPETVHRIHELDDNIEDLPISLKLAKDPEAGLKELLDIVEQSAAHA